MPTRLRSGGRCKPTQTAADDNYLGTHRALSFSSTSNGRARPHMARAALAPREAQILQQ